MDNLHCKMQAHARVCEEKNNKKKATPIDIILQLKVQVWMIMIVGRMEGCIKMIFSRTINHSIKALLLY